MKPSPSEDELRCTHDVFNANHEQLRHELLNELPRQLPSTGIESDLRRRSMWLTAAMTACVALVLVAWFSVGGFHHHEVFALEGVQERMQQIRSIYVKGAYYQTFEVRGEDVEKTYPLEWYAERSSRYFHTWSGTEHDDQGVRIQTGFAGVDGDRAFSVSDNQQVVTLTKSDALATELQVESMLQHQWMGLIVRGATDNYRLVGTELIRGEKSRKYEWIELRGDTRSRNVIWISEATGLPVRSVIYDIDKAGHERMSMNHETIEFNGPPPANRFPFVPPEGFRVVEAESRPMDFVIASGSGGNEKSAMRYPFAIGDRAVLICWSREVRGVDPLDQKDDPVPPEARLFMNDGGKSPGPNPRLCELLPLQTHVDDGHLWRWSLALPVDRQPIRPGETLELIFRKEKGGTSSYSDCPLKLADDRLIAVLWRMEELGEPLDKSLPRVSLNRLRRLAERHANGERRDENAPDED